MPRKWRISAFVILRESSQIEKRKNERAPESWEKTNSLNGGAGLNAKYLEPIAEFGKRSCLKKGEASDER